MQETFHHVPCPDNSPPVDVKSALARAMGDQKFLEELLNEFIASMPVQIQDMSALLQQEDASELARAAHTLKGTASNMSAGRIVALARRLENSVKKGDFAESRTVVDELKQESDQLQSFLKQPGWINV